MSVSALQQVAPASTHVPCNLCGADDAETLFERGVAQHNRIVKCRRCGLMYSNPRIRPADQELVKDYDPDLTRNAEEYDPSRFDKERMQVRDYADTRKELARLYPDRGKLIELGCGMGFLLKAFAEDGWDVTGIEPDRGFCEYIEQKQGLKALPAILEDSGIPDNSVDVVVFLHVIEHVPDPLATLQAIHRVLKPGGHLVLETPRYDSLMFRMLGKRERSLSCDGHIYFFTTDTLKKLSEKAGFTTRQWRYVGRSLSLDRLAWNVGVMSKSKAVQTALRKTADALRFDKLHFKLNMRDMQRILVQKPAA
jgi:2-polyprenyl-3-methyl-5-hydroxy-6-metoxy-1,4-benzoquinol methylase